MTKRVNYALYKWKTDEDQVVQKISSILVFNTHTYQPKTLVCDL